MCGGGWGFYLTMGTTDYRWDYVLGMKKINSTKIRLGWINTRYTTWSSGLSSGSGSGSQTSPPHYLIEVKKPPNV
jgi:hypothetical protein